MGQLAVIVEGHGDDAAAPVLCARILHSVLKVSGWFVQRNAVRQPRSRLVDERTPSPKRPVNIQGLNKALAIAHARPADAALVLCDADDDCPASFGRSCPPAFERAGRTMRVGAVMASREFESWLLWSMERARSVHPNPEKHPRDAKRAVRDLAGRYRPRADQADLVRSVDLRHVWAMSDSFDKLVRTLADLVQVGCSGRPSSRA